MSKPNISTPSPVAEVKQPDTANLTDSARRNRSGTGMAGGSLLTGPAGLATPASTTSTTLLGS